MPITTRLRRELLDISQHHAHSPPRIITAPTARFTRRLKTDGQQRLCFRVPIQTEASEGDCRAESAEAYKIFEKSIVTGASQPVKFEEKVVAGQSSVSRDCNSRRIQFRTEIEKGEWW
jgi:hypothetical protein